MVTLGVLRTQCASVSYGVAFAVLDILAFANVVVFVLGFFFFFLVYYCGQQGKERSMTTYA
jgi:hypothetical protein